MAVVIPTVQEIQDRAITEVQTRNPRLTDTNEGSFIDALTGAGAVLADETIRLGLAGQARFFFDTAIGAELDALAADRGFPARKAASSGAGEVQWTKVVGAAAYTIPAATRIQGTLDDGTPVVVESTASVVVQAIDTVVTVPCIAQATGPTTNLSIGFLDTVLDTIPSDPAATVTNAARFVGGAVVESDEAYRSRLRLFFSTLRRATVAAIKFGALLVAGVQVVTVSEATVPADGIVRVYIGDPDARSNALQVAAVVTELENWRAAGVQVVVLGADREEISVALTVTVPAGTDIASLAADIRANIVGYTDTLEPSEVFRISELYHRAHDAGETVLSVVATAPVADVTPTATQDAIRVNSTDIALTFLEV
jgi:hypothetical protein